MAEEKDTTFKVTDRRMFNADGTPREQAEQPLQSAAEQPVADLPEEALPVADRPDEPAAEEAQPEESPSQGRVVSFPGEADRKKEKGEAKPQSAGSRQQPKAPAATASPFGSSASAANSAAESAYEQANRGKPSRLPEGPFLSLVNMLAFEAAIHLGMMQTPGGQEVTVDLEAARPMIDMLGTLQEKTRGNLTPDEDSLLDNILADLRMQFVALSRRR